MSTEILLTNNLQPTEFIAHLAGSIIEKYSVITDQLKTVSSEVQRFIMILQLSQEQMSTEKRLTQYNISIN